MEPSASDPRAVFLSVNPGDLVVIQNGESSLENGRDWWLGHVIHSTCGARDHRVNSIFQVADVDTGFIRTINADLVRGILRPRTP